MNMSSLITHQSEGSEHRQPLYISQPQLHQTQAHNEAIKDIPALLEVVVWIHRYQLDTHFSCEDTCEHLRYKEVKEKKLLRWSQQGGRKMLIIHYINVY